MDRNKKIATFFRYGVPMFIIGYGTAVLLFVNKLGNWEVKYSLYGAVALLAISVIAQWLFSHHSAQRQ